MFISQGDQDILSQISQLNVSIQREWDERRKEKIGECGNCPEQPSGRRTD